MIGIDHGDNVKRLPGLRSVLLPPRARDVFGRERPNRLGRIVFRTGAGIDQGPTVDRIIPELGYVKGNVIVVSHLANRIKQDATPDQIRKVAEFYEQLLGKTDKGVIADDRNDIPSTSP